MLFVNATLPTLIAQLVILGLVCHQITHILTVSRLFRDVRRWVHEKTGEDSNWSYLVGCHLCASTWVAAALAAVAIYEGVQILTHVQADFVILTFLVAFVARVANEILAYAEHSVAYLKWRAERDRAEYERTQTLRELGRQLVKASGIGTALPSETAPSVTSGRTVSDWTTSRE